MAENVGRDGLSHWKSSLNLVFAIFKLKLTWRNQGNYYVLLKRCYCWRGFRNGTAVGSDVVSQDRILEMTINLQNRRYSSSVWCGKIPDVVTHGPEASRKSILLGSQTVCHSYAEVELKSCNWKLGLTTTSVIQKTNHFLIPRWQLQREVVCIPKSTTPSRIKENIEVTIGLLQLRDT